MLREDFQGRKTMTASTGNCLTKGKPMTRDEYRDGYRKACADAIADAMIHEPTAYSILDSLHDVARLCPIGATEEMMKAGKSVSLSPVCDLIWQAMSAAGDLTNAPRRRL